MDILARTGNSITGVSFITGAGKTTRNVGAGCVTVTVISH